MNDSEKLSYYDDTFGDETITEKNLFDDEEALKVFLAPILEMEPKISALAKTNKTIDFQAQENLSLLLDYIKSYLGYLRPHQYQLSSYFKTFVNNVFVISPISKEKHILILDRITFLENHNVDQI